MLLITDDGQLAHQLLSPKKHVDKTYFAVTEGKVVPEDIEKIREGVDIGDEELTLPGKLEILKTWEVQMPSASVKSTESEAKWRSEILLTIHEGRFHQVKRMMEALGKTVIYLKRMSMGPLVLPEDFPKGQCRELTKRGTGSSERRQIVCPAEYLHKKEKSLKIAENFAKTLFTRRVLSCYNAKSCKPSNTHRDSHGWCPDGVRLGPIGKDLCGRI